MAKQLDKNKIYQPIRDDEKLWALAQALVHTYAVILMTEDHVFKTVGGDVNTAMAAAKHKARTTMRELGIIQD